MTAAEVRRRAFESCLAGRFDEADRLLLGLVNASAEDLEAWVLLAKLRLQQRDVRGAMSAAATATRLRPAHAEAWYVLGRAHRANNTLEAAEQCYRRSLALAPDPDVHTSLGVLMRSRGNPEEAIRQYRAALQLDPAHVEASNNLGNALAATGHAQEGGELIAQGQRALSAQLQKVRAEVDRLLAAGQQQDARAALSDALRIAPNDAELWLNAGKLDCALGRDQSGLDCVERAVRLAPDWLEANEVARTITAAAGILERAQHFCDRVLTLKPSPDVALGCELLLSCIQQSNDAIHEARERFAAGLTRAAAEQTCLQSFSDGGPGSFMIASHAAFYLAYHGLSNRDLQSQLAQVYLRRIPGLVATAPHCRLPRRPGPLRIGLISRFLCRHSIGATTRGLVAELSRPEFEVTVIRITPSVEDEVTAAIRDSADRCVDLDQDFFRAREQIASLELDVLFYQDIGMEPRSYFLAFSRLARVQCVSFGHPDTTGIPNMDYFVSNDLFELPGAERHYSERLFLLRDLPTLAYYYRPRLPALPVSREKFGFAASEKVYLCPQTLFKLHPDLDPLLLGILSRDPDAVIVLIDGSFRHWSEALRVRFQRSLPGVAHRVRFVPRLPYANFLELIAVADVILDTPHFNGMNTSLEAFALCKPVVTLPTALQRGRHTQAMYRKMGLAEYISHNASDYVDLAVRIATDREFSRTLSDRIRSRQSRLFEDSAVVREFERFFVEASGSAPLVS